MPLFSFREQLCETIAIQTNSMNKTLRMRIWNVINNKLLEPLSEQMGYTLVRLFFQEVMLHDCFQIEAYSLSFLYKQIREFIFDTQWYKVYDLVDFILQLKLEIIKEDLTKELTLSFNNVLELENSPYRILNGLLAPVTSEVEIKSVETALASGSSGNGWIVHLKCALERFSDREQPDYRNTIKESISAVEAISKVIANDENATLNQALDRIEREAKINLHTALKSSFSKLYGYTSSKEEGIRHALLSEGNICEEDARFMLVVCSAFVNYLKVKSDNAGIQL